MVKRTETPYSFLEIKNNNLIQFEDYNYKGVYIYKQLPLSITPSLTLETSKSLSETVKDKDITGKVIPSIKIDRLFIADGGWYTICLPFSLTEAVFCGKLLIKDRRKERSDMKIRNELLSQVRSYAGHTPHAAEDTLDCSLGVNPYGFPPVVKEAFAAFDPERFYHYPHSDAPQKAIVDYWADYAFIEPENIVLTDGSVSALYLLCNILAKKGAEVVGFLPTFTDMVEYSRMMAMRYVGIPARREENWRMEVSDLVDAISGDTSLVYIDRPNNPTGQTLSLADISRVLDRCEELGVYAIVDEAYGDFLPREESAVTLGPKYKNIIIVRTFSKGFGLAGLRAGYIITGQELIRYISKVSNPYMMSELSRELAAAALSDRTYADSHGPDFAAMKQALRGVCGKELTMAVTDDRVPICLLQHRNPRADLQELLMAEGVLTCSGGEFEPLDRSSVRLRVPRAEELDKLLRAVEKVNNG